MWKLMKLEYKKYGLKKYIIGALIVTGLIGLFMYAQCFLGIANDADTGVPDSAEGMQYIGQQITLFTNLCYLVFTASMLATFIVAEWKNKGMNLMFSYPIKRQKILVSKMLAVWIFNFVALFASKLLICGLISAVASVRPSSFIVEYNVGSISFYVQAFMNSAVTVTVAYVALWIGKMCKSSKATIIASFLLFLVMNGTIGDFSLSRNSVVPLILAIVGLMAAYFCLVGVETKDVM